MFGKKYKKEIAQLQTRLQAEFDRRYAAETKLSSLYGIEGQLETAHEQIKDLAYENDDLNRKIDLLESVLKQLNIPVKLATRKASERA